MFRPEFGPGLFARIQVRGRRYLNSLHITKSEQTTSTPGAPRGISPRSPAKSVPRSAFPPLIRAGLRLRSAHGIHQPHLRLCQPIVQRIERAPEQPPQRSVSQLCPLATGQLLRCTHLALCYNGHIEINVDTIPQIPPHSPSDRSNANSKHAPGASLEAASAAGASDRNRSVSKLPEPAG